MRRLLFLPLLCTSPLLASSQLALHPGEELTYRVSWGLFARAGEIKIFARGETDESKPCTIVTTTTSTRGFLRGLYEFDARAESVFVNDTGRMIVHTEKSLAGRKPTDTVLTFDYSRKMADYRDLVRPEKNQVVHLPSGDPMDLITCLVQTRTWNLKPGDQRDVLVMFEEEPYELTFHALGYETVRTPLGTFNTLVIEPRMEKTAPKGMFKRGSTVRVWIAQDEQRLPVKFEVEFKFGVGVSTLTAYTPPADAVANADPRP
ncbi:MAG: DUF3108 domain-containing protein [Verrucomicrobia bacterium]|nr:DUF3108 domain-containing protein [Verrucomicrobiota bacterium]